MANQQQEMNAANIDRGLHLPPGFRFHPSDDEIVTHYLSSKVCDKNFTCDAIGEVDVNKTEPWDLPDKAKMGKKEYYFFYKKDLKYSVGLRANRATDAGFWKVTGKDKEVYHTIKEEGVVLLVGMKKTLVFYKGRAPRGHKTNWVMHEYRLEGKDMLHGPGSASSSLASYTAATKALASASKNEWVVCRVFHKTTETKKVDAPEYQVVMVGAEIDQNHNISGIPIPMPISPTLLPIPMSFPIMPDFAMDLMPPYYPNINNAKMMSPITGFGCNNGLQINDAMFDNLMATPPPMNFYHQMGMAATVDQVGIGAPGAGGFNVAASKSHPYSKVLQKDDVQDSSIEISSIMCVAGLGSETTNMDMDGIWKY